MHKYTFKLGYEAHTTGGNVVKIPDQVCQDQKGFDSKTFPILRRNGTIGRAMLMGEEYGLWTTGTGDAVVKMI